jgi:hypothetical protein
MSMAWLEWAGQIFTTPESHLTACQSAGGTNRSAVTLNPGFVGPRYPSEGGGVLCLGLANGPTPPQLHWHGRERHPLAADWTSGMRDAQVDERFFTFWQSDFVTEVDTWPYWKKHFQVILETLDLEPADVAHTNLAPCRMEGTGAGPALAFLWASQHPISRLLSVLDPAVVLVATILGEPNRGFLTNGCDYKSSARSCLARKELQTRWATTTGLVASRTATNPRASRPRLDATSRRPVPRY